MNATETELDNQMLEEIRQSAREGAELIGVDLEAQSPQEIVEKIDAFVSQQQRRKKSTSGDHDAAEIALGGLWGEQLVRALGWEWSSVTFHDHNNANAVGVFSPDRSLVIYPLHFIFSCLENAAPVTILLAFNMLQDGSRIPELPPRGFENVMDNVHHVVSRD